MSERQPSEPISTKESEEPEVEALRVVVRENASGEQMLELVEGSFERSYGVGSTYTTKLFAELCRSRGLLPYRHARQHKTTVCVRASLSEHEALWSQFLALSSQLTARLHEVTSAFVTAAVPPPKR